MKNNRFSVYAAVLVLMLLMPVSALAYDADRAAAWLDRFAQGLSQMAYLGDPRETEDPARAGQVLLEYEFGTVLTRRAQNIAAEDILEIDVRTPQVMDCRGMRVGMGEASALSGVNAGLSSTPLYVLGTQDAGLGWSWAYVSGGEVYGVEYITYGGDGAAMTEYTLTYVIDDGVISAIRMKMAPATLAQAQEGLATAEEIASRQMGEVLAMKSDAPVFAAQDLTVMGGRALGADVAGYVARIGEPDDVQTLPEGRGRMLIYDGAVVRLSLDEYTGVEIVRGVSVSSGAVYGPRGLSVGMAVQEAAALFRCDKEVSSLGGVLYLEGEALGEPPCGELMAGMGGEIVLRYVCLDEKGRTAVLEAGVRDGIVTYWHLFDRDETEGGV